MTTTETVAVAIAAVSVVVVIALIVALVSVLRTVKALQALTSELRGTAGELREVLPLATELRTSITDARGEIERLGSVTKRAENITATVDSASQLAYLAFSNPVIKTMAAGAGITRGWRTLRKNRRS